MGVIDYISRKYNDPNSDVGELMRKNQINNGTYLAALSSLVGAKESANMYKSSVQQADTISKQYGDANPVKGFAAGLAAGVADPAGLLPTKKFQQVASAAKPLLSKSIRWGLNMASGAATQEAVKTGAQELSGMDNPLRRLKIL